MVNRERIFDLFIFWGAFFFVIFSVFSISLTTIAAVLSIGSWILKTLILGQWKQLRLPLLTPFLFFFAAGLISIANSVDVGVSLGHSKKFTELLIFFWVINILALSHPKDVLRSIMSKISSMLPEKMAKAMVEAIQSISPREFFINLLILTGVVASLFGFYQELTTHLRWLRVPGTFGTVMTFAGILMMLGLLTLGRILFDSRPRPWVVVSFIIIMICLLFTLTRMAWFGFLAGAGFLFWLKNRKLIFTLPIILISVLLFAPLPVTERLMSVIDPETPSLRGRLMNWEAGWAVFKDYPLTGCGFRCGQLIWRDYPEQIKLHHYPVLHSSYVQLAVDAGILGLGTWLYIWFSYFRVLFGTMRVHRAPPEDPWVGLTCAGVLVGFLVSALAEANFYDTEVAMLLLFILALPFVSSNTKTSTT